MSKSNIFTFSDLMAEKERLLTLQLVQKKEIKEEITSLKEDFKPANLALKSIGYFTNKDNSTILVNALLNNGVDFISKKLLLKNAGWAAKIIFPFVTKKLLSSIIINKIQKSSTT